MVNRCKPLLYNRESDLMNRRKRIERAMEVVEAMKVHPLVQIVKKTVSNLIKTVSK
jgi:hypothetical protein